MKIICIGRNYVDHIKELKNKQSHHPIFFLKPDTAIQPKGHPFFIPNFSNNIQYEVELVIKINKTGKHIEEKFANRYYDEIGLGVDFTARDIQEECKKKGLPWEIAKGFDGSAQIGFTFINKKKITLDNIIFSLRRNNEIVQNASSKDMIFSFDYIISYISKFYTLKIGDLIFTGTPSGVGTIKENDFLEGYINKEKVLEIKVK
tara:strand:+ start:674 stop:1285 length:612 start_codon:yes stop_codon:yes gene_type:complete